jgi:zinc protease
MRPSRPNFPFWRLLALAYCLYPLRAMAAPEEEVYPNVILVRDDAAKSVKVWLVVKAGFRDELHDDPAGVAHYVEHLFIVGRGGDRKKSSPLLFANADANAFTLYTGTAYWHKFPYKGDSLAIDLDKAFQFFAERISSLDVSDDEARRERDVVRQEYEWRVSSDPSTTFNFDNNKLLEPDHPIGRPGIGTRESIASYTLEAARRFHDRYYAKNNVVFIVAGPVEPALLRDIARQHLEPLPEKPIPDPEWLTTLRSFQPMEAVNVKPDARVKEKLVRLEKIVRYEEPDRLLGEASADVLAAFLESRLEGAVYDELVEKQQIAKETSVARSLLGVGSLWFTIDATPEEGVEPDALKAAIEKVLSSLAQTGLSESVVERFKARSANRRAEMAKTLETEADALAGDLASEGRFDDWLHRDATAARVTPASIQPLLDALAKPGRELLGVLAPAH